MKVNETQISGKYLTCNIQQILISTTCIIASAMIQTPWSQETSCAVVHQGPAQCIPHRAVAQRMNEVTPYEICFEWTISALIFLN